MKYLSFTLLLTALLFSCQAPEKESPDLSEAYLAKGDSISQLAQAELLKNVSQAMKEGGPVHTIAFCKVEANPIMDSLSRQYEAKIGRITFKARNPANAASSLMDSLELQAFARELASEGQAKASIVRENGHYVYYSPIRIGMETCLQCHGAPETEIASETLAKLNELYPQDQAQGYAMGELRGAWKVRF